MIVLVWVLSGFISIPPLLGWKKDVDLTWFWELLASKGNQSQMDFLQDLEESGSIDLHNFTQTLETVVYPTCGVSISLLLPSTMSHTTYANEPLASLQINELFSLKIDAFIPNFLKMTSNLQLEK